MLTAAGVLVADVAWASDEFMLCVEVVSPSNSRKELNDKVAAYLGAGAEEVLYAQSKRCELHGRQGLIQRSRYTVDLADVFSNEV